MNSALKGLLENRLAAGARSVVWRNIAARDSAATRTIAADAGYENLDVHSPLVPSKTSSTLFILGSGSSILDLTDTHFEHIKQHTSLGINVWAIHPFVPDAYCFETGQETNELGADTAYINRHLKKNLRATKTVFLFLRPRNSLFLQNMVSPPDGFKGPKFMYGRANLVSSSPGNLETDLRRVVRGYRNRKTPSNLLLDNGASVARMILLGALQGFRRIVLVGIDLDRRPYFWQSPEYRFASDEIRAVFSRPSGSPHDTLETQNRPFPTDEFIYALSKIVGEELASTVYVGSADSTLAGPLPVYSWPWES